MARSNAVRAHQRKHGFRKNLRSGGAADLHGATDLDCDVLQIELISSIGIEIESFRA
jgi:hypothetical protein